jgi:hypothetical protein
MVPQKNPTVGDRVRIERDETRYPSKGTWPQFRGRVGTVVEVNADRKCPHLTEYGVVFGKVSARSDGRGAFNHQDIVTWFKDYEMVRVAPERHADGKGNACPIGGPGCRRRRGPGRPSGRPVTARRKVPSAAEAKLMADAEAARMAAARRETTAAKEKALQIFLAEVAKMREQATGGDGNDS